ncbi:MAG: AAA family ATPase [Nitrososphaeria archaeon]|nr:AAA family ATPase [Nitrososphaeria archaeon]MDW7985765.1 AAA family ATPase [Nitrososphaerota archaeon]
MIEEVWLKNFEGYENVRVKFTEGLNLITGRNSVGKTALLDSIVYGLFGVVPGIEHRLLVAHRSNVKETEVYIRFKSLKNLSRIEVYRILEVKHGRAQTTFTKLLIDGKEVQVESLEELRKKVSYLLGVGYRTFNWIVYSRQGRLIEILEPEKKEMDTVLGISLLRELAEQIEQAKKKISRINGVDVESEYRNLVMRVIPLYEERLREVEKDIEVTLHEIEELKKEIASAESPVTPILFQKVRELEKYRNMFLEVRNTKREFLSRYGLENITSVAVEESRLREELKDTSERISELEKTLSEKISEHASISGRLKNVKQHLQQHKLLIEEGRATCPTCGQDINQLKLFQIISEEEDEVSNLEKILRELEEDLIELKKKLEEAKSYEKKTRERRERLNALIDTFRELDERENNINKLISLLEVEVSGILKSLNLDVDVKSPRLYEEISLRIPSLEMVQAKKDKLRILSEKLSSRIEVREDIVKRLEGEKAKLREIEKKANAMSLANNIKEKLDKLIEGRRESILKVLASRALDILNSMMDQRAYHSIIIDPETYSVSVHPVGLLGPIPAVRIGGGHQTLISLALRLSILSFIGFKHLIILDEPTYGVDQENLQLLLEYLTELRKYVKQAIIVTHYGYALEEADNIITVYKEGGISRVKQEL